MFTDARRFFARIRHWDTPDFTGIHYTVPGRNGGKAFWRGKPVQSIEEAVRQLAWITKQTNTRDVYVALGTQRETQTMTKDGRPFQVAWRAKENTVSFKTLFVDIDVKDGAYPDRKAAVEALGAFVKSANIPTFNMVVASGTGGLHVYWVLDRDVPAAEWHWMGLALANAGLQFGLKFDSQCSYDYTRVLRVPDTQNFKMGDPLPVQLLLCDDKDISVELMAERLEPFRSLKLTPVETNSDYEDELLMGLEPRAQMRDIAEVSKQCGWVRNSLDTGGRDNNNALRLYAYGLAQFCHDAKDVAWRMVHQRATLDDDEFETTYERVAETHLTNPRGFPRCNTIEMAGAMECRDCPLRGTIASPLSKVRAAEAPVVIDNWTPCPTGYTLDNDGFYWQPEVDENGAPEPNPRPIFPKPIHQPWLAEVDGDWCLQFITTKAGTEPLYATINLGDTSSKDSLGKALRKRALISVPVTDKVFQFMTSFIDLLQSAKQGIVDTKPFGWQKGLDAGFAFGAKNYTPEGIKPAPFPGDGLECYGVQGSPDPWMAAAKCVTSQGRPSLDVILASAFAAPLVNLCGGDVEGFVIGAVSGASGVGKTTTLNIAQAVWASPQSAKMGLTDTVNSTFGKAGNLRHLPLYWDEIKGDRETKNFIQLLFQLTGGKEKNRMTRAATVREAKTWSTILVYGTNSSLSNALVSQTADTVAGNMRLFEFNVPAITDATRQRDISTHVGALNDNYGHAGAAFSEYIGSCQRELRERLAVMREEWAQEVDADDSERFWVAACATILLGAELANKIGLTEFDVTALRAFLKREHKRMKTELGETQNNLSNPVNVQALFSEYLASQAARFTLFTNKIPEGSGAPRKGAIKVIGEGTSRINKIETVHVHIGMENRLIRLSRSSLTTWSHNRGLDIESFIDALKLHLGAKVAPSCRIGAGTEYTNGARPGIEIHTRGTPLDAYIDELDALQASAPEAV
jgi:hypothetical protein